MIIVMIPVLMGLIIGAVVIFTVGAVLASTLAAGIASVGSSLVSAWRGRQAETAELPSFGYLRLKAA